MKLIDSIRSKIAAKRQAVATGYIQIVKHTASGKTISSDVIIKALDEAKKSEADFVRDVEICELRIADAQFLQSLADDQMEKREIEQAIQLEVDKLNRAELEYESATALLFANLERIRERSQNKSQAEDRMRRTCLDTALIESIKQMSRDLKAAQDRRNELGRLVTGDLAGAKIDLVQAKSSGDPDRITKETVRVERSERTYKEIATLDAVLVGLKTSLAEAEARLLIV